MLSSVKSGVSFSHVHCDHGHAYLTCTIWPGKEIMTPAFPLDFFYILVCAFLFVYFTSYCCSCYEGALKKIDQMWSEYHFFYILENFSAKEFSENSWETLGFSRKILLGNLARSREYKQYRKQKRRAEEGAEKRTRYEVTKIAPSAFFGGGDGEWGFRREGRGELNLICLWPGESHPFKLDKLTTSHPFSPNLYHHLVAHPVPLVFC